MNLVAVGVVELTVGVLSGWLMVAAGDTRWRRLLRIEDPRRIRQGHLDLLIMGAILVAIGAGVDSPPALAAWLIGIGSWLAPLLFFPPAWSRAAADNRVLQLLDRAGFVMLTVGYLVLAWSVVVG